MNENHPGFVPSVPDLEIQPELTVRAVVLGALLGVVFGAASTYLALRVGLTVSASVPIAVIAIAVLRRRNGSRAILEHNIAQTTGSAGESVAAAVAFSIPALIFLGYPLEIGPTTLIALTGGVLGVLMMVPLRRYLIVKEHETLRYPEGRACAEILEAGEQGGTSARKVFVGMATGAVLKALVAVLGAAKGEIGRGLDGILRGARVASEVGPELLGVGYIIGYRTSVIMVGGSLLASFILIPLIVLFGAQATTAVAPAADTIAKIYAEEGADGIWNSYIRHIGAGAVATGGIFALLRALPAIITSLRASLQSLRQRREAGAVAAASARTDRDTPMPILLAGGVGLVLFVWLVPMFHMNLLGALLILVLGFLFAVVSSRVTGEVGSTSNPLSGMTIGVLMATCGAFLLIGWSGSGYARLAIMVGAVVCIAISNAGTCSQDLKTGYLVGATPVRQQGALLVGVLTSVLAIGWTAYALNSANTHERRLEQPFAVAPAIVERGTEVASASAPGHPFVFVRLLANEVPVGASYHERQDDGRDRVVAATAGNFLVDRATGQAIYQRQDGIGTALKAPQARLMSTVIDGLLTNSLPWGLVAIGVAIALFMELLGIRSLTFSVGVYLPLASTMPVFLGGLVRKFADLRYRREPDAESEKEGTLFSSGVIAGAAILGILAALLNFTPALQRTLAVFEGLDDTLRDLIGLGVLLGLGGAMFRMARDPIDARGGEHA